MDKKIVWCGNPIGISQTALEYSGIVENNTTTTSTGTKIKSCRNITDADIVIKRTNDNNTTDYLTIKRCAPDRLYVKYDDNAQEPKLYNDYSNIWNKELCISGDTMKQQDGIFSVMRKNNEKLLYYFKFSAGTPHNAAYALQNESGITDNMFEGCDDIIEVGIPSTVKRIGNSAFEGCSSLSSYTPVMNTYSGGTFSGDTNATCQTLMFAETIGEYAFHQCTSLKEIKIGGNVSGIGDYAFAYCTNATTLTFENIMSADTGTLKNSISIPKGFCHSCEKLSATTYVYNDDISSQIPSTRKWDDQIQFPSNILEIGEDAFASCSSISYVDFCTSSILSKIGYGAFKECTGLTSVTIPDSVTSIGEDAFSGCTNLISVTIPSRVEGISSRTFNNCTSLTSCTIGDSVTSIGSSAFTNCTRLTSIDIPIGVTSIGNSAFEDCSRLTSITVHQSTPDITVGNLAFHNVHEEGTLYVPSGTYQVWDEWKEAYLPTNWDIEEFSN